MNHFKHQIFKHQLGISLVEVMVAMVISLFLLGGIIQVYLANKTSYAFSNAVSRIQENGRFSLDTNAQDLRMAGFFGCAVFDPTDTESIVNNLDPAGTGYDAALHDIIGGGLLQGTENDGLNGSDSITIRGAKPGQYNVYPPYGPSASASIFINNNDVLEPGDIVMISNCQGADVFQISGTTQGSGSAKDSVVHNSGGGSPGNYNPDTCKSGHCLSQVYGADASMFQLQTVTYTIAPGESGEPALWRSENGTDLELIDGIEQMQVLYGVDTDDDDFPNRYLVSTAVPDMLDVISIRLMLLARSGSDSITEDFQKYSYNSANVTAGDQRLRQVFSTTIALRNRIGD
jgi:type IV pilus assembly protein PilW